jgi:hypothetical protein
MSKTNRVNHQKPSDDYLRKLWCGFNCGKKLVRCWHVTYIVWNQQKILMRRVLGMLQTFANCYKHVANMLQTCAWHVTNMWQAFANARPPGRPLSWQQCSPSRCIRSSVQHIKKNVKDLTIINMLMPVKWNILANIRGLLVLHDRGILAHAASVVT